MPNLARVEVLIKRKMLIEHAHPGRPYIPNYEGDEFFMGVRESRAGSGVDPAVIEYMSDMLAQLHKIKEVSRRAAEDKTKLNNQRNAADGIAQGDKNPAAPKPVTGPG